MTKQTTENDALDAGLRQTREVYDAALRPANEAYDAAERRAREAVCKIMRPAEHAHYVAVREVYRDFEMAKHRVRAAHDPETREFIASGRIPAPRPARGPFAAKLARFLRAMKRCKCPFHGDDEAVNIVIMRCFLNS